MTPFRARLAAGAIVAVPLVAYPLIVAVDGVRFPSQADCVRVARAAEDAELDLVFGRRETPSDAQRLLERVRGVGYADAELRPDGCGRWEVLYDGIESYEQGIESRAEARGAGLEAELEIEPPG